MTESRKITKWRGMLPNGEPATPWFDILPEDATEEEREAQIKKQAEQYEEWKNLTISPLDWQAMSFEERLRWEKENL